MYQYEYTQIGRFGLRIDTSMHFEEYLLIFLQLIV